MEHGLEQSEPGGPQARVVLCEAGSALTWVRQRLHGHAPRERARRVRDEITCEASIRHKHA